jgi:DNA repair protein RadD
VVDCTGLDAYNWFFDQGYLVPPVPRPTKTTYDLKNVSIKGGEYDPTSLAAEVDNQKKNESAVLEMLQYSGDRNCGLVFCAGVDHVKHVAEIFEYYGQSVTWVATEGIESKERDRRIAAYKEGEYKWMINNDILITGFDHPPIDFIGMLRHTLSTGRWVQMLGRGTRPLYAPSFDLTTRDGRLLSIAASGKHDCLTLDFADNVTRLGTINDPRVPEPKERKRKGDAPVRICDECGCYNHAAARRCWHCGFIFPRDLKIDTTSSSQALVAKRGMIASPEYATRKVDRVVYVTWKKPDRPDSMKVMYHSGPNMYSEWVCFEHGGYASHKAHEWWRRRSDLDPPETTAEAMRLKDLLQQPRAIRVVINQPNGEIVDHEF